MAGPFPLSIEPHVVGVSSFGLSVSSVVMLSSVVVGNSVVLNSLVAVGNSVGLLSPVVVGNSVVLLSPVVVGNSVVLLSPVVVGNSVGSPVVVNNSVVVNSESVVKVLGSSVVVLTPSKHVAHSSLRVRWVNARHATGQFMHKRQLHCSRPHEGCCITPLQSHRSDPLFQRSGNEGSA